MKSGYQNQVAQYLDELKSEDTKKRENSCKHLDIIAKTFGEEKSKSLLLPFLEKELEDDEEEVLLAIINSFEKLIPLLGGKNYIIELFPHFQKLLGSEDRTVRIRTIEVMDSIFKNYNISTDKILQLAKNLNKSNNLFSKISSILVLCRLYNFMPSNNISEAITILSENVKNDSPPVRKELALNLRFYIKSKTENIIIESLIKLLNDSQELVKVNALESLLINLSENIILSDDVYDIVCNNFKNNSWRMRYIICNNIENILRGCKGVTKKKNILENFLKCLNDSETEIKILAIKKLQSIIPFLDSEIIKKNIINNVQILIFNVDVNIKIAIAEELFILCQKLNVKEINDLIIPHFNSIMNEKNPLVKISIFKNFYYLVNVVNNKELVEQVLNNLKELSEDKNWKIRIKTIETLCNFVEQVGKEYSNNKIILNLFKEKLNDEVFSVREKTINCLVTLSIKNGIEYCDKVIIPIVSNFINSKNYLFRLNYLISIQLLSPLISKDVQKIQFNNLNSMIKDKVANVRYNVLRAICKIAIHSRNKEIEENSLKLIRSLDKDSDSFVSKFANSLKSIKDFEKA